MVCLLGGLRFSKISELAVDPPHLCLSSNAQQAHLVDVAFSAGVQAPVTHDELLAILQSGAQLDSA